ncbi:ISL3 family transposase [Kitasatospora sp. SUK 42]|uniref:ISL3 family transposase n=3 Tax=Kitasatospora sp. SUK 42 TaxID=1588882 RepID=UPI0018C9BBBC|nr:ISL3 family transposase [Kitasatospora sp. SUK 42]MBV2156784.1 ISL3 family transposase [Kitasatospora sp. SUK 42]
MLPQLAAVQVERVEASGDLLRITARTRDDAPAVCPACGQASDWVHSRYVRHVADEAVGGRAVVIDLSVRRLYCENPACEKVTFAEQVTGLTRRYQRRTPALQTVVDAVAVALAGSAGARLLGVLHHVLSWACVLNCLMRIALPARPAPQVLGIDEFALRRGHRYATILIDATTGERIEVLPDRRTETVTAWMKAHPDIEVVCRDGAGGFAQAVTDADPAIVQVCDRWHLWHGLAEAVQKEVAAHSACWAKAGPPLRDGTRAQTTRERWQQVHELLGAGVGLLECSRRLGLALNTVKRYARHTEPERMVRAPLYRPTLVDPYRDHLRRRRAEEPAVPVTHLLREIKELGYTGSANLLVRYINQGRVEADHASLSPRKAARLLLTDPAHLREDQQVLRDQLAGACPEMTALADAVGDFAALLTPAPANAEALTGWITRARAANLPFLHAYATGLERDRAGVDAALTLPWHNGRTEGVNNKIKLLKRQTYGRAGHRLLRQRILLS